MKKTPLQTHIIQYFFLIIGASAVLYSLLMLHIIIYTDSIIILLSVGTALVAIGALCPVIGKRAYVTIPLYALFFAVILALLCAVFLIIYGQFDSATCSEDAAVILGCGLDGEEVTPQLARRLDAAVEYHASNPDAVIVVSGGQGPNEDITEALAMEKYLLDSGIPKEKIIKEGASTSTSENLAFSKEILDEHFDGEYTVTLITSEYHIYRASRLALREELNFTRLHGRTPLWELPMRCFRELMAIVRTLWLE